MGGIELGASLYPPWIDGLPADPHPGLTIWCDGIGGLGRPGSRTWRGAALVTGLFLPQSTSAPQIFQLFISSLLLSKVPFVSYLLKHT